MEYVLMVFLGTGLAMHDFGDATACDNARNTVMQTYGGSSSAVVAYCVPKGGANPVSAKGASPDAAGTDNAPPGNPGPNGGQTQ